MAEKYGGFSNQKRMVDFHGRSLPVEKVLDCAIICHCSTRKTHKNHEKRLYAHDLLTTGC